MRRLFICALLVLLLAGCKPVVTPAPDRTAAMPPSPTPLPTATEVVAEPIEETEAEYAAAREAMVHDQIEARGIKDEAVLTAMRKVPRHQFVPVEYLGQAYEDHPLPIGYGQTISQPYIVALMTEALKIEPGSRVLEIGTGSGYQAAVLAALQEVEVYTVEIIPELAEQAEKRLAELGYAQVHTINADGYFGWPEHAPYDAIIVTAAPDHLPQPLVSQLKEGGQLIIPIGPVGAVQTLWLFEMVNGELQATNLGGVRFVPLTGEGH